MSKISIKNMDGTMEEVDLVNAFKINELNKHFDEEVVISGFVDEIRNLKLKQQI